MIGSKQGQTADNQHVTKRLKMAVFGGNNILRRRVLVSIIGRNSGLRITSAQCCRSSYIQSQNNVDVVLSVAGINICSRYENSCYFCNRMAVSGRLLILAFIKELSKKNPSLLRQCHY